MGFEKELRIGNLVYGEYLDEDDVEQVEVCRVMGVDETSSLGDGWNIMMEGGDGREWYHGIPLTEEWMEKEGWVPNIEHFCVQYKRSGSRIVLCPLLSIPKRYAIYFDDTKIASIQHVHQLQNLFYALTGEELTLKE